MIATIPGTLNADGSLELDEKPNLPPGKVIVTVAPVATPQAPGGLAAVIDEIRGDQAKRNFHGRGADEIEAVRREGEAEYETRLQSPGSGSN
ncbi:MAG: hypothetical protein U0793_01470 [Gemmataceae bacterium]